jgi:hypothetical protein
MKEKKPTVFEIARASRELGRLEGMIDTYDVSGREPPEDLLTEADDAEKDLGAMLEQYRY